MPRSSPRDDLHARAAGHALPVPIACVNIDDNVVILCTRIPALRAGCWRLCRALARQPRACQRSLSMSATCRIKQIDQTSVSPTIREIREKWDQVPSSDEAISEPGGHQWRRRRFSPSREGAERSCYRSGGCPPDARCCAGACARHGGCAAQPLACSRSMKQTSLMLAFF